MSQPAIALRDVGRRDDQSWIVRHLDLEVPEGTILGLLGPAGSGKSVVLRMVLGLLRPDEGSVRLEGRDPLRDHADAVREVGYAGEAMGPCPHWSVRRVLEFSSWVHPDWDGRRAEALRCQFALPLERRVDELLPGQRSRLGLLLAVVRRPRLLVLDEPFAGLDESVRREVAHRLGESSPGRRPTVMAASSHIAELAWIVDHVAVLRDGRIRFAGSLDQFRLSIRRVRLSEGDGAKELASFPWVRWSRPLGAGRHLAMIDYAHEYLRGLSAAGYTLESLETPGLEETAAEHLGRQGDLAAA